MKLAVCSDFHLGRKDRTDRFEHDIQHFHAYLDHLEESADEVILLGDIIDTHHGRIPLAFFREVRIISGLYSGLVDRLLGGNMKVVAGNHDSCLSELPGIEDEALFQVDGRRILMIHGHQFDRLIRTSPTLCAIGNYLGGAAERHGLKGALALLDWIDDAANGGVNVDRNILYREKAIELARQRGVDTIVLGHTHQQDRQEARGVTYLNVGANLGGRFEYGFIDTATGIVEARKWS
jgi:predicted phosphodiesterase